MSDPETGQTTYGDTPTWAGEGPRAFEAIGPYRLLERVGSGGMGDVWLAEQTRPVHRQVALKVIKAGMDTADVVARFDAERQALAVMAHPAIAQVFDAGATPEGRPYFVMEYVRGEAITSYCSRYRLSTRQRIDLFVQVCEGVHHAHQKGIIHRDLKPSNILVTLLNDLPVPKIIDFGLAKATSPQLTERALYTQLGVLIGTPAYMSPEQAEMTGLDVDTRSDVYSLGVILYELLTGTLPFDEATLHERGLDEYRRTIREDDPPLPSTRVSALAGTAGAEARGAGAAELARQLRGDLDWIILRALEKDRTRRYGSVSDFVADLQRYLDDRPVLASPPSTLYRLRKFARRHRAGVTVGASLLVLLLAFAVTTGLQARRIADERDRANREAEIARAVNDFLQKDLLAQAGASAQARPDIKPDPDLKVRTALDRAAAGIQGKFDAQPLVEASIRQMIGTTYADLGLYPEAEPHLVRALDLRRRMLSEEDPGHLASMSDLATLYVKEARFDLADPLLTRALAISRRAQGEDHPQTLTILSGLGRVHMLQGKHADAEAVYGRVLEGRRRVMGEEHPDTLESMDSLASLYWRQGKYAQAEPVRARVVELQRRVLGEEHPATLTSLNNLALLSSYQGKYVEAESQFLQLLPTMRRVLGEDHVETMISAGNLGIVYFRQGRYSEAETIFTGVLDRKQRVLGETHPETLTSLNNLAVLYRVAGKYGLAEPIFIEVLDLQRRVMGAEHPNVLLTMNGLGLLYELQGRNPEAEQLYTKVVEAQRRTLGADHPDTITTGSNLALLYVNHGKYAAAEPLAVSTMEARRRVLGDAHPDTLRSLNNLGLLYLLTGRHGQAEALLRGALETYRKSASDSWERYNCESLLGASLMAQQKYQDAEPLITGGYEGMLQRKGKIPPVAASVLARAGERVIQLYERSGRAREVATWKQRIAQGRVDAAGAVR